jgi:type II secretory pathway pseudopilin PulG
VQDSAPQQFERSQLCCKAVGAALRWRHSKRWTAFSIMELIVVLMIMSIVAAVAAPSFHRSLEYHQLESAARRVKQDLEYLQATARTRSMTLECEFDGLTYTMGGAAIRGLDRGGDYVVNLAVAPYDLESVVVDLDGETSIEFNGYGEAAHDATITLGVGDETRSIEVVAATGAITSDADN